MFELVAVWMNPRPRAASALLAPVRYVSGETCWQGPLELLQVELIPVTWNPVPPVKKHVPPESPFQRIWPLPFMGYVLRAVLADDGARFAYRMNSAVLGSDASLSPQPGHYSELPTSVLLAPAHVCSVESTFHPPLLDYFSV